MSPTRPNSRAPAEGLWEHVAEGEAERPVRQVDQVEVAGRVVDHAPAIDDDQAREPRLPGPDEHLVPGVEPSPGNRLRGPRRNRQRVRSTVTPCAAARVRNFRMYSAFTGSHVGSG